MPFEQHVIEYFQGNELKLGWVAREKKSKLLVVDRAGRNDRVAPTNVLLSHGPIAGGRGAFAEFARQVEDRTLALAAEIDTELLWDSLSARDREYSAEELAAEYFEESTPVYAAAAARAVLKDPIRFRRIRTRFRLRSREEVEKGRIREARQAANAALRERAILWLREVLSGDDSSRPTSSPEASAGLEATIRKIEDYILADGAPEARELLEEAFSSRPPRAMGVELLARLGRLPAGVDRWLLERGAFPSFPKSVEAAVAALVEYSPEPARADFSALDTFSIDDADTREIDDALSVETDGDRLAVYVHIADPSVFVRREDPVDRAAVRRPLSLYLPTTVLPMLPERIGCDLASLNADRLRPSLSFCLVFDADGRLADWEIRPGQVRVARRMTYVEAEKLLEGPATDPVGEALRRLSCVATHQRAARLERGALVLARPEPKIQVRNGQISFQLLDSESAARRLVAEMMILANSLAALYALRHDVPVIYRVQGPPKQAIKPMEEYDPVAFEAAVRSIGRSRFSTHPQPHAGLGVDLYTQLSSPIRRYSDMVLQRQLTAHFRGETFPYTRTELIEVLGLAEAQERENRQLERAAVRYWTIEFLRRQPESAVYEAVLLPGNRGQLVELPEFMVRGRLTRAIEGKKGAHVKVRLATADPEQDRLLLEPVRCEKREERLPRRS
ncbi:MAG: RNB domain-containing ribonuclease [Kiritimatiellaeota bacterium]|nr:RNB domain-containing ribonuclease [Kiritimatiellota bacterium]